jgi:hypothetical protein
MLGGRDNKRCKREGVMRNAKAKARPRERERKSKREEKKTLSEARINCRRVI